MANVTVVGAQWGDEGKGKIVDWLTERAEIVVRFQGGHNAGHTLVVGENVYKLSLLPSGIVRGALSVIGNGVVLDPWHLETEIAKLRGQGVTNTPDNLQIAETCPLILPFHRDLDGLREDASGAGKIGTTRRGIGPAYEDKVGRRAIRVCDLAHLDDLGPQIERLCAHHDALRAGFGEPPIDRERLLNDLRAIAGVVLPICQAGVGDAQRGQAGGQAHPVRGRAGHPSRCRSRHLSVRHLVQYDRGARGGRFGSGPNGVGFVLGIVKAYTTRVGSGPFPTELDDATGERLGTRGHEIRDGHGPQAPAAAGSTRYWCGRRRRCRASRASR